MYSTQDLFFRLLPKLDVVGSSPIARSLEVLKFESVVVAGIRTGPGDLVTGPISGPSTCSTLAIASSPLKATRAPSRESGLTPALTFPVHRRPFESSIRIFEPGNR